MATEFFVFAFPPIKCLINDITLFSADLDLSRRDLAHQLYSEDNKKAIGKMKLESYRETELEESMFSRSKS